MSTLHAFSNGDYVDRLIRFLGRGGDRDVLSGGLNGTAYFAVHTYLAETITSITAATESDGITTLGVGTVKIIERIKTGSNAGDLQDRLAGTASLVKTVYNYDSSAIETGQKVFCVEDSFGTLFVIRAGGGGVKLAEGKLVEPLPKNCLGRIKIASPSVDEDSVSWTLGDTVESVAAAYYQTDTIPTGEKVVVRFDDTLGIWVYVVSKSDLVFACPVSGSQAKGFVATIREEL